MHQENETTLDLTLDTSYSEHHLTPHVDKAVSVIGLVEKERKLYKAQAHDYKRRIQELEAQLVETKREARDTQAKFKKTISDITESLNAAREQLALHVIAQEDLQREKAELRSTIMKLQSMTTSLWRNIPDLLKRTATNNDEHECEHESTVKDGESSMETLNDSNDANPTPDASMDTSLVFYSPEGRT